MTPVSMDGDLRARAPDVRQGREWRAVAWMGAAALVVAGVWVGVVR